jgi:hypothetical protein
MSVQDKVQAAADALAIKSVFLSSRERAILDATVTAVSSGSKTKTAKKKTAKKKPRR